MKILLFVLCLLTGENLFSQSFFTFHNEDIIEKRNYTKGKLQSIICYEQNAPKDSMIYDGNDVQCFRFQEDSIVKIPLCPYTKFYYCEFDESLRNNYIYNMIKSHLLLERILYFLAIIDSEVTKDDTLAEKRQVVAVNKDSCCIQYKKINIEFWLFAEFESYRYEPLMSMCIDIYKGLLTKISLKGKKTDVRITFEYQNQRLMKEKIFYYKSGSRRFCYYEEYHYEMSTTLSNRSLSLSTCQ